MKALTSVTCVVLTLLVLANRLTEEYIRTLRNSNSEMFDCFFNICAPWKSCTGRGLRKGAWGIVSFVLEIAICLFHIPPGVQGHVHSTWTFGAEDDLGDASKDFDVNINIYAGLMLLKIYVLLNTTKNCGGYHHDAYAALVGKFNQVDTSSFLFSIRVLLKEHPLEFLTPMIILLWVLTALMMLAAERICPGASIKRYDDALWVSIITMSTVGYGDMSPVTAFGRIWCVVGGVAGGTLVVTLITAVFITMTDPAWNEMEVIHVLKYKHWEKHMRSQMCRAVQRAWRLHSFISKIPTYENPKLMLEHVVKSAMRQDSPARAPSPAGDASPRAGGNALSVVVEMETKSRPEAGSAGASAETPASPVRASDPWKEHRVAVRPGPHRKLTGISTLQRFQLKSLRWLLFDAVDELRQCRFHRPRTCSCFPRRLVSERQRLVRRPPFGIAAVLTPSPPQSLSLSPSLYPRSLHPPPPPPLFRSTGRHGRWRRRGRRGRRAPSRTRVHAGGERLRRAGQDRS